MFELVEELLTVLLRDRLFCLPGDRSDPEQVGNFYKVTFEPCRRQDLSSLFATLERIPAILNRTHHATSLARLPAGSRIKSNRNALRQNSGKRDQDCQ